MTAADKLRRRIRCARRQRGAAVFVVVLVITLLTALGLFAVRAATLANSASGYHRQLVQVHYITDYAIHAAISDLGDNPEAVKQQMIKGPNVNSGDEPCAVFEDLVTAGNQPTCWLRGYDDIDKVVYTANNANELLELRTPSMPGSLGPSPIEGDMRMELTDLHPALPVRGHETAGGADTTMQLMFVYVTVSASGLVRPSQAAAGTWDLKSASAAGVETSRAHAFMGPVLMQK